MAEAAVNLSPNVATQRVLRHRSAVMTLARMRAKRAVLLALQAEGLKPQHFSAREIAVLTEYYLNQHRAELTGEAAEAIDMWPGFARWRYAAEVNVPSDPKRTSALPPVPAWRKADPPSCGD